jgi:hypothetical protein
VAFLRVSRLVLLIICFVMISLGCSCSKNQINYEANTQEEVSNEQKQDHEQANDEGEINEQGNLYFEENATNLNGDYDKKVIGMWHSPIGSSSMYGNRYIFCEDGTYVFFEPEQLENPNMEFGTWNIANKKLILRPTHIISEVERVNNENDFYFRLKKESELKEKIEISRDLSEITYDSTFKQDVITIDGYVFYKIFDKDNPIKWVDDK